MTQRAMTQRATTQHPGPQRIVFVTHEAPTRDDSASRYLAAQGFEIEWTTPVLGGVLPALDERYAGAVIMGGGQPVTEMDRHSFLRDEMDWMGRWLAQDKPLLSICLGAQLLAHHLGAAVGPHPQGRHEFGLYPLIPTPEGLPIFGEDLTVMQFHYHGFDVPTGATLLARSQDFPQQAFRVGETAYGFQFHPEAAPETIARWQIEFPEQLTAPGAHGAERQQADMRRHGPAMTAWFEGFLDELFVEPGVAGAMPAGVMPTDGQSPH